MCLFHCNSLLLSLLALACILVPHALYVLVVFSVMSFCPYPYWPVCSLWSHHAIDYGSALSSFPISYFLSSSPHLLLDGLSTLICSGGPHSSVAVAPCLHPRSRRFHGFPQSLRWEREKQSNNENWWEERVTERYAKKQTSQEGSNQVKIVCDYIKRHNTLRNITLIHKQNKIQACIIQVESVCMYSLQEGCITAFLDHTIKLNKP